MPNLLEFAAAAYGRNKFKKFVPDALHDIV
jgi:hypothetical protein